MVGGFRIIFRKVDRIVATGLFDPSITKPELVPLAVGELCRAVYESTPHTGFFPSSVM